MDKRGLESGAQWQLEEGKTQGQKRAETLGNWVRSKDAGKQSEDLPQRKAAMSSEGHTSRHLGPKLHFSNCGQRTGPGKSSQETWSISLSLS